MLQEDLVTGDWLKRMAALAETLGALKAGCSPLPSSPLLPTPYYASKMRGPPH